MKYKRLIACTMVLQFLGLAISSCSTEFGPIDRSAKATIDSTETESNLASTGSGIAGASPYSPGKVPGDSDSKPENSRSEERSSYLPELGSFVGEDSFSDVLDLCADIPKEFFESIGITETHPKLPGGRRFERVWALRWVFRGETRRN